MKSDRCRFCNSRHCLYRIYRDEVPLFDEIACRQHGKELEKLADATLDGKMRTHVLSSLPQRRERPAS